MHGGAPLTEGEISPFEKSFALERFVTYPLEVVQCMVGVRVRRDVVHRQDLGDGDAELVEAEYPTELGVVVDKDDEVWNVQGGTNPRAVTLLAALRH